MTVHPLVCGGPHAAGVVVELGTVELPDNVAPGPVVAGYLCGDCGDVYAVTANNRHPAGQAPSADDVADVLPGRRPAGWKPGKGYRRASWDDGRGPAWPPPRRPA